MASFKDICFTPSEFANLVKIERNQIPVLEEQGLLKTMKKRVGNVDRKMISLEGIREYCKQLQNIGRRGDQENTVTQTTQDITPTSEDQNLAPVATATEFVPQILKHKIQMFYNVKGGTGKSTLTAQYVMRAAMMGYNILALDLDGQGHLTVNLDILDAHERPTIYDVLINDLPIQEAIINVAPGLDLVPGNLGLCNIEIPLNQKTRREYRLTEAIKKISEHYDLIVADTNPAASILNCSMLVAADLVNVVCATNPLSFHGMSLVMATIEEMEKEFSRKLEVKIIPNFYDSREVISQEVLGELKIQFASHCSKTVINKTVDFNEATKRRTTIWDVNPRGVAAQDLSALTEELLFN
ncbi:MAG: ParA family protein [Bdellovibrio sp.]|nr:ParA family protein [Bdellovibrio sp.]